MVYSVYVIHAAASSFVVLGWLAIVFKAGAKFSKQDRQTTCPLSLIVERVSLPHLQVSIQRVI
jgi:hypothetical protein